MRKSALIAATAAASFGVAAVAQAIPVTQSLTVKTTGSKGTKTKPRALKLDVTTGTTAKDGVSDGTFGTKIVTVFFDKNLRFNASKFPTCRLTNVVKPVQEAGKDKPSTARVGACSAASKVGAGSASAVAGPGGATKVNPDIIAYNGTKADLKPSERSGALGVLHLKLYNDPVANTVITGTLRKATGTYGYKLVVPIPKSASEPVPGFFATINRFNVVVSNKAYRGNAYAASTGCSGGSYKFKGDFTLTDNQKDSATTTSRC